MSASDFEGSPDYTRVGALSLGNDPETGQPFANVVQADEFDPSIANDVEGLLMLGYLTKNVAIFGHTFTLKTLTRGERLAVLTFCKEFEETLGIGEALETATLALAIVSADNRPLSVPLGPTDTDPQDALVRNWSIVSKWYDPVLNGLYLEYRDLQNRMLAAFQELQSKSRAGRPTP